ncbi:hypothetical protein [Methylovulum miyakonense]|uniref:hypothetical protein n=1 Tax=Methylovulum miyakonense TaxID=645578 RepID=UPI000378C7E0|nr:hypothetical protein [Methylovulum miyakonense]
MNAPRTRSPNYPAIDLGAAVDLATKFEKLAKRHPYPVSAAVEKAWEMKPGSSRGLQMVAALKQFGLITDEGSGDARKIKLTDSGARIIANVPNKSEILKELALQPKVHFDIWEANNGSIPPDETLRHYLSFDYSPPFNSDSIDGFLKQFRGTLSFSGLDLIGEPYKNVSLGNELHNTVNDKSLTSGQVDSPIENNRSTKKGKPNMRQEIFTLDEGDAIFEWPEKLSQESYDDLESWLEIVLRKAKRAIEIKSNASEISDDE